MFVLDTEHSTHHIASSVQILLNRDQPLFLDLFVQFSLSFFFVFSLSASLVLFPKTDTDAMRGINHEYPLRDAGSAD